jgi:hypothetical protein
MVSRWLAAKFTDAKSAIENMCPNLRRFGMRLKSGNRLSAWCWLVIGSGKQLVILGAPQSVANWLKEYADSSLEKVPKSDKPVEVAEQDEQFTFIGEKNEVYIMIIVDRQTPRFLAIQELAQRSKKSAQKLVDAVPAAQYFSDQSPLWWKGAMPIGAII